MTRINRWECFTYTAAAQELGVAVWRVRYAVESGSLPRPGVVFRRRALFSPGQMEWMRAYFDRTTSDPVPPDGLTADLPEFMPAGSGAAVQA